MLGHRAKHVAITVALTLAACFHDFDEPFSGSGANGGEPSTGGGASTGGNGSGGRGDGGVPASGGGGSTVDAMGGAPPDLCVEGTSCAPPAPNGWTGPIAMSRDLPNDQEPACSDVVADLWSGALTAHPATCTSCACGAATGAMCGQPTVEIYDSGECNILVTTVQPTTTCMNGVGQTDGNAGMRGLTIPIADPGSCLPVGGGVAFLPEATFAESNRLCAIPAGGGTCDGTCVAAPADPYEPQICIAQQGDLECPAGSIYTTRTLLYGDIDDARGCTSCTCSDPVNVSCSGSAIGYSGNDCTNQTETVTFGGNCKGTGSSLLSIRLSEPPTVNNNGSCTHGGGTASGIATPADPWTVCCAP